MKFGKNIKQEQEYMAAQAEYFMSYISLKKLISLIKVDLPHANNEYSLLDNTENNLEKVQDKQKLLADFDSIEDKFFQILEEDIKRLEMFYNHTINVLERDYERFISCWNRDLLQNQSIEFYFESQFSKNNNEFDLLKKRCKNLKFDKLLKETYERMTVLLHQCEVNRTGFRKIVKKWDKNTGQERLATFLADKVDCKEFAKHNILNEHILTIEKIYADLNCSRNIEESRQHLAYLRVQVRLATGVDKGLLSLIRGMLNVFKNSSSSSNNLNKR